MAGRLSPLFKRRNVSACAASILQGFDHVWTPSNRRTFVCDVRWGWGELPSTETCQTPSIGWRSGWRRLSSAAAEAEEVLERETGYKPRGEDSKRGEDLCEETQVGKHKISWKAGKLARFADGACVCGIEGTAVLATVVSEKTTQPEADMVPLQVDYRERLHAAGRIPTTFNRREGAPKDREVLCMRAIDRAIRPLFPPGFCCETQVIASVLSADGSQDPDILAINAVSAALTASDVPWEGPVGAVRIGCVDGEFIVNPSTVELIESDLNLTYAGTWDRTVMVECQANEVDDGTFGEALRLAQKEVSKLIAPQKDLARRAGRTKRTVTLAGADPAAAKQVMVLAEPMLKEIFRNPGLGKEGRALGRSDVKRKVHQQLNAKGLIQPESERVPGSGCVSPLDLDFSLHMVEEKIVRQMAIQDGLRVDGRGLRELRRLFCQVECTQVVHGSALFERGDTQSLCTATVGGEHDTVEVQSVLGESTRHLMVHYSFPPFATCEVSKTGGVNRREIGHGNLAERALSGVMPDTDVFPFPVRVVTDTLMSNGSSSMAAACGGALALKDAGVPIKSLVAGVSIGLMTDMPVRGLAGKSGGESNQRADHAAKNPGSHCLLVDIQGLEDHLGDMDFKIAGTAKGITAAQLDVKMPVSLDVLSDAWPLAGQARATILEAMEKSLPQKAGPNTPQFGSTEVNKDLVGHVIGEDGETIRRIESDSGARLIVKPDSNEIRVYAPTKAQYALAKTAILDVMGANIREGEVYNVKVVRIVDFGAFVELPSGFQTLLHISDLSHSRIRAVEEVLHEGQELKVKCLGRDPKGNVRISRKALQPAPSADRGTQR
ncbi:hypothetical protein BSKO_04910 [Bryopsis sp. KO-2023]|nr:hypothetical protein BSKO_04910 [Bryopsis sp. KO-2023]